MRESRPQMPHGWGRVPYAYADRLPWMNLPFPVEEYHERMQRLRTLMMRDAWDCAVVVGNQVERANIRYLTNFGRYYQFEDVQIHVTPVQRPCPIPIASNPMPPYADEAMIERALRRVGQIGDGWMVEMSTPEEFGRRWQRILHHAREAGRDPLPADSMIHFYVNVQDNGGAAFEEARRFYESYHMGTFPEEYLRWRLVTGTPEEVTARLAGFINAGCTLPIIRFASYDPLDQMRRAMHGVIPALRDHAIRQEARTDAPRAV